MSPKRIVDTALKKGIDIVAVCDHNSAENVQAAIKAASGTKLAVFSGMEVTSAEEAHVIGLFADHDAARALQDLVYEHLAPGENDESVFGTQIVANELDEIEGYNKRLLIAATDLPVAKIVDRIHELQGLAIASHVDREAYSIIGQLGFIPEDLNLDALEISSSSTIPQARGRFPEIAQCVLVTASDAHHLDDIGKATIQFMIHEPTLEEVSKAFHEIEGRRMIYEA
jgi:predicted metal-dependent phosphoesterase TrpH